MSDKLRVVVVDDSKFMRQMLKDILMKLGHDVVGEGENGHDGAEKFKSLKPDLVTIDLVMPESSGIDGLKEIRQQDGRAVVIIVSALEQKQTVDEALSFGATDFIIKPFTVERVLEVLEKLRKGKAA